MKIIQGIVLLLLCINPFVCSAEQSEKHLFILSGQSNMHLLDPKTSFIPTVESALGAENIVVIKDTHSGFPIRRWYRNWRASDGSVISYRGPIEEMLQEKWDLFKRLLKQILSGREPVLYGEFLEEIMETVNQKVGDSGLASVTFVWMHGERDARESYGDVYERSLIGLHEQLKQGFGRQDINFVLGRISDWDMKNEKYPDWTKVREAERKFADSFENVVLIDTDDLNSGLSSTGDVYDNDLHYSAEGYRLLGERFARVALELIDESGKQIH